MALLARLAPLRHLLSSGPVAVPAPAAGRSLQAFLDIGREPLLGTLLPLHGTVSIMECGRGDKKTKRGKRFRGTFGKCRPTKKALRRRLREKWELPPGAPLPRRNEIA